MNFNEDEVEDLTADDEVKAKFSHLYVTAGGKQKPVYEDDVIESAPCGSRSPYYEWLQHQKDVANGLEEPVEGNPDSFSDGLWTSTQLTPYQELQLDLVQREYPKLTKLQQEILVLVGWQGKSLANAACMLGLSKSTVQTIFERIRKKLRKKSKNEK